LKSKTRIFGTLLTIALCAFVYAHAATRYVSHSGSNAFPYTSWETASSTIEAANLATLPGDTMLIDTGSFYLSAPVYPQPATTMRGRGMDSTRILGSDSTDALLIGMFRPADSNRVEDIHFIGHGSAYAYAKYTSPHLSFFCHRCKFSNFTSSILSFPDNREIEVRDCWFETWGGLSYAISFTGPGDLDIENNTFNWPDAWTFFCDFVLNTGTIIFRKNVVLGGVSAISGGFRRLEFVGNLFYRNRWLDRVMTTGADDVVFAQNSFFLTHDDFGRANDVLYQYLDALDTCLVYNNVFAGYQPRLVFTGPVTTDPTIKILYNCFYSLKPFPPADHILVYSWDNPVSIDSAYGNVYADPMFVDPWNGDLRLQKGSPCIDAGAPWILDVDGTRSDIGAFGGPDGAFYIYQDLPPLRPTDFTAQRQDGSVLLRWQKNTESDFRYYILFRSDHSGVPLDSAHVRAYLNLDGAVIGAKHGNIKHLRPVGSADTLPSKQLYEGYIPLYSTTLLNQVMFIDDAVSEQSDYCYVLLAVDSSLLVSQPTPEIAVPGSPMSVETAVATSELPEIEQNYPNPFNATTAIVYSLPNIGAQPAPVRLAIYNILGEQVKSLVDDRQQPGRHTAYWDGTDDYSQPVASGVYLYRLEVSGIDFVKSGKMILMK
jgi:hypothetical protein